jgi:hypothetical protein
MAWCGVITRPVASKRAGALLEHLGILTGQVSHSVAGTMLLCDAMTNVSPSCLSSPIQSMSSSTLTWQPLLQSDLVANKPYLVPITPDCAHV